MEIQMTLCAKCNKEVAKEMFNKLAKTINKSAHDKGWWDKDSRISIGFQDNTSVSGSATATANLVAKIKRIIEAVTPVSSKGEYNSES